MKNSILLALTLLPALSTLPACMAHIEPHQNKVREFDAGEYPVAVETSSGSLFALGSGGLLEDTRPRQVGDVVVINIDESDSASQDDSTNLDRSTDMSFGLSGAAEKLAPNVGLAELFGAKSNNSTDATGRIHKKQSVKATLPVRVRRVLGNGDLYIEGTKVVLIGEEQRHLYLSGIARKIDVRADGTIDSSRIAEAEIEYTGQGINTDNQRQGALSRFFSYIWPF